MNDKINLINKYKGLTHIHIYYKEQVNYFVRIISMLNDFDCKIFVTHIDLDGENINMIKDACKSNKIKIIKVNNLGFDVYPFIQILNQVELDDYDYVLKLHSKCYRTRVIKHIKTKYYGYGWRDMLILPLVKNKKVFSTNLNKLFSDTNIGMLCSKKLIMDLGTELQEIKEDEYKFLKDFNLPFMKSWNYCSGTIFLIKPEYLKQIKNMNISEKFFENEIKETDLCINPAATIERIFGYLIENKNKKILGVEDNFVNLKVFLEFKMYDLSEISFSKILKNIFSIGNSYDKHHKIIKILGFKIKIKRGKN